MNLSPELREGEVDPERLLHGAAVRDYLSVCRVFKFIGKVRVENHVFLCWQVNMHITAGFGHRIGSARCQKHDNCKKYERGRSIDGQHSGN
jgi:hypothetical protein